LDWNRARAGRRTNGSSRVAILISSHLSHPFWSKALPCGATCLRSNGLFRGARLLEVIGQVGDPRDGFRSNVFLNVALEAFGITSVVKVRNISAQGALLEGKGLPSEGTSVRLRRGTLEARGEIAWESGSHRGLRFDSPVDVRAWVRRIGHSGQQGVDGKLALLRRGENSLAPDCPAGNPARDSIGRVSADLDSFCSKLAHLPELPIEIEEELIQLDAIARRLRQVAKDSARG